jgi:hypothetical protein
MKHCNTKFIQNFKVYSTRTSYVSQLQDTHSLFICTIHMAHFTIVLSCMTMPYGWCININFEFSGSWYTVPTETIQQYCTSLYLVLYYIIYTIYMFTDFNIYNTCDISYTHGYDSAVNSNNNISISPKYSL